MGDWGPACECCGAPDMEEVMSMHWWCWRCHWTTHELETQAAFEFNMRQHREVCSVRKQG